MYEYINYCKCKNCNRVVVSKGYCYKHYTYFISLGTPDIL